MIRLNRVLLATDFSDATLQATRVAIDLARSFTARLVLLHVVEDPVSLMPALEGFTVPSPKDLETYAEERLSNWIGPGLADDVHVEHHVIHDEQHAGIVRFAAANEIDLIVVGTHGRSWSAHVLLGSVAEKVLRHAPCPVLTVPSGH